jgi:ribosomal protein S12 methylthiotransferase
MKIGFLSLGCPKNLVDGEVMLGLAREAGHEITPDADTADVLVVNTCAFIDRAKEESIDAILEMAELKKKAAGKRLIVTGCLAERYRDQLKAEIPEIDAVLGTGEVPAIVDALEGRTPAAAPVTLFRSRAALLRQPAETSRATRSDEAQAELPTYLYDAATPRLLTTPRHYAYVKVGEGCDYTCAFCIIPTLRGKYRSRDEDSIVAEAERLAAGGVRELLLISQDTTFFGLDRGQRGGLARLLRRLNAVGGLSWIRLLYLYPTTITNDVLDAMAECEKLCKYIDLPLQHASAGVLRRMRRPGNREAYDALLARIRSRVPVVSATRFDHVGVFTYSHEEGTRAFAMDDDVPAATKEARKATLMQLQKRIVARRQRERVGEVVRVMVDGPAPGAPLVIQGRLEGQAPDIDAVVFLSECDPAAVSAGDVIVATVTGARDYDLVAVPLPA